LNSSVSGRRRHVTLVWLDLGCLVVQPPVLFELGSQYGAALRLVHIRNVGMPAEALNDLVCFTFEDRSLRPGEVTDIAIRQPLRHWLEERKVMG
jgi:hypothetical protein